MPKALVWAHYISTLVLLLSDHRDVLPVFIYLYLLKFKNFGKNYDEIGKIKIKRWIFVLRKNGKRVRFLPQISRRSLYCQLFLPIIRTLCVNFSTGCGKTFLGLSNTNSVLIKTGLQTVKKGLFKSWTFITKTDIQNVKASNFSDITQKLGQFSKVLVSIMHK